jgi:hypothetical protein
LCAQGHGSQGDVQLDTLRCPIVQGRADNPRTGLHRFGTDTYIYGYFPAATIQRDKSIYYLSSTGFQGVIMSTRMVGSVTQGSKEKMAYGFDFTAYGTPTSPTQYLWEDATTDVSATNLEAGTPSILSKVVTSTRVKELTPGHQYRLEMVATITETGNFEGMYLVINAE